MDTKKFKVLTAALALSFACNVALLVQITRPQGGKIESKGLEKGAVQLQKMASFSFRELVSFLTNKEPIEGGYSKRELAVAALVCFHDFYLEKALGGSLPRSCTLSLPNQESVTVFPNLTEEEYEAIIRFAYQEKWPLTAKGLFKAIQANPSKVGESLQEAFFLTAEFQAVQNLFSQSSISRTMLFQLISQGSWEILEECSKNFDLSATKRRDLLLKYLALRSPVAAEILIKTDGTFALQSLDEPLTLDLLSLLKNQTEESVNFCLQALKNSKNESIQQAAAIALYSYAKEVPTLPIDSEKIIARFSGQTPVALPEPQQEKEPLKLHIVKEGETLWKISRQYQVKVDEIIKINGLEKDSLFPGMTLKLP